MKPVTFDGWLIVILSAMPAFVGWISGDEAAKYIDPKTIFYLKGLSSIAGVGLGALKGYRSTQFAQYKANGGGDPSHMPLPALVPAVPVVAAPRPGETQFLAKESKEPVPPKT